MQVDTLALNSLFAMGGKIERASQSFKYRGDERDVLAKFKY